MIKITELDLIDGSKAEKIKKTFEPMAKLVASYEEAYNRIIDEFSVDISPDLIKRAKRLRLDIGKVRIETGKLKDKQKEYIKLEDKAIMGVHNVLVWAVKEKEDKLKEIENYFEVKERERLAKLQKERETIIDPYLDEGENHIGMAQFSDEEFNTFASIKRKQHEDRTEAKRKAKEAQAAREEAERIERERIKKENEELRAKVLEEQRLAKEEADKRAKAEAELQAKRDKEERLKKQEEYRIQQKLQKGDADFLHELINDLKSLQLAYSFDSDVNKEKYRQVCKFLAKAVEVLTH